MRSNLDSPENSDSRDARYYDLVAFDPRGIGHSKPIINCFPNPVSRDIWNLQGDTALLKGSNYSFAEAWSREYALSEGCSTVDQDGNDAAAFCNATPVSADMVEITERLGQWRERTAKSWLQSPDGESSRRGKPAGDEYNINSIRRRTKWMQGREKIQFWGFSYGTVIGATFAAMYPDRIHRFILDGVVDSEEFYKAGSLNTLLDTDKVLDTFFKYCFEAGPSRCKFHLDNSSPEEIRDQFDELLERAQNFPIAVPTAGDLGPETIRYEDIIGQVLNALYKPITQFSLLDDLLTDLVIGNGSQFSEFKNSLKTVSCPSASCENAELYSEECDPYRPFNADASRAIFCTDGDSIYGESPEDFKEKWNELSEDSELFSDMWIFVRMGCVGWKLRPSWRFSGKFPNIRFAHYKHSQMLTFG